MNEFTSVIPGLEVTELEMEIIVLGGSPDDEDFNHDLGPCF
jgi:hypothetical protein